MTRRFVDSAVATLAIGSALALPGYSSAAGFSTTCQILDPVTQEVRSTFVPGDLMLVRLGIDVPPEAADRQVKVKLSARAEIAGIAIPFTLDEIEASLPNTNPDLGQGESDLPWSGTQFKTSLVEIPEGFPVGAYTIRAKATIEGLGKQACEVKVQVLAPAP